MPVFGFDSVGDMFDGGGPGASGGRGREGGASAGLTAEGTRPPDAAVRPADFDPDDGPGNGEEWRSYDDPSLKADIERNNINPGEPMAGGLFGGYVSLGDMFDGGGPGMKGDSFEGYLGGVSNATGAGPAGSGFGSSSFDRGDDAEPFMASSRNEDAPTQFAQAAAEPVATAALNPVQIPPQVQQWLAQRNNFPTVTEWVSAFPVSYGSAFDYLSGNDISLYNFESSQVPEFEEGGYVGPGGQPIRPQGQGRLDFATVDQQVQEFIQQNPQAVQQINQQVQQGLMSGEITPDALNVFIQVAVVALQNPEMWPNLRRVLIQQGFLDDEDIGEEYDEGFLITLYIMGKAMGGMPQAGRPQGAQPMPQSAALPMSQGQPPVASMRKGGALPPSSANPDGSIPINAHEGEYVVPADVVRVLGTRHFDTLIEKTRAPKQPAAGGQLSGIR